MWYEGTPTVWLNKAIASASEARQTAGKVTHTSVKVKAQLVNLVLGPFWPMNFIGILTSIVQHKNSMNYSTNETNNSQHNI